MFGYLAIEDARIPFQYAFTVLSSLQGFLIFVLMVVRRRQVRDQWRQMCCVSANQQPRRQKKLSPASSSSTTSNNSVSNSRTLPSFINHTYNGGDLASVPPYPLPSPSLLKREASIHVQLKKNGCC
ncbi:adhesion G-protein coupled receptor g4 [Plakobranchus ocellatus]|uniref:Adhesion G-protein coupled receptor g4 n=1 Tax=Plakobranchus ocellatus TaxID=259542 RepID=A0AAV4E131_9GAST|nr:adhesion G-protein coupled receptor g4 [Plakobranchus ocellatus]